MLNIGNSARGRVGVPCGDGAPTLIIASVGTSSPDDPVQLEVEKAKIAVSVGAGAVTDHSFYGDIDQIHSALVEEIDAIVSTVTSYEFAATYQRAEWRNCGSRAAIDILRKQVHRGVDLLTIHASLLRNDLEMLGDSKRTIPTTSKGGGILSAFIRATGSENPYYEHFDEVLDICGEYDATISLGTTFRPATVCDNWDGLLCSETERMGELVERALSAKVGIMVEGFGHASLDAIPTLIALAKMHCHDAPYRILPMATDRALGYDHISGAIATAVSIMHGANAVTAMSRAEHIGLPSSEDLVEAVIATRVAVASGELAIGAHRDAEMQMSRTRWAQGCKGDWSAAIYPEGARQALETRNRLHDQLIQCGMCGDHCGINAGIAAVALGTGRSAQ